MDKYLSYSLNDKDDRQVTFERNKRDEAEKEKEKKEKERKEKEKKEKERKEKERKEGYNVVKTMLREPYSEAINNKGWFHLNTYKHDVHSKIDDYGFMTERIARENAYYTNNYMHLAELKAGLVENNPELKNVNLDYFLKNPYTKNTYEKYLYYLHFLIIFYTYKEVDDFLCFYRKQNGVEMMRMFINYPLVCHFNKNIITPLMCAMLWSNDPKMVRVLYSWGADVSITDVHNNYCENIYSGCHYYYNHLFPFIISRHIILGVRDLSDFSAIRKEMKFLSKEKIPDERWKFPVMKI